jgi:hypothetical protein
MAIPTPPGYQPDMKLENLSMHVEVVKQLTFHVPQVPSMFKIKVSTGVVAVKHQPCIGDGGDWASECLSHTSKPRTASLHPLHQSSIYMSQAGQ